MTTPPPDDDWRRQDLLTVSEAAALLGWDKQRVLSWVKRRSGSKSLEGGQVADPPARDRWKVTRRSVETLATSRPDQLGPQATWHGEAEPAADSKGTPSVAGPDSLGAAESPMLAPAIELARLQQELEDVRAERDELRNRVANLEQSAIRLNDALLASHVESGDRLKAQSDALRVWLVRDNPIGSEPTSSDAGT